MTPNPKKRKARSTVQQLDAKFAKVNADIADDDSTITLQASCANHCISIGAYYKRVDANNPNPRARQSFSDPLKIQILAELVLAPLKQAVYDRYSISSGMASGWRKELSKDFGCFCCFSKDTHVRYFSCADQRCKNTICLKCIKHQLIYQNVALCAERNKLVGVPEISDEDIPFVLIEKSLKAAHKDFADLLPVGKLKISELSEKLVKQRAKLQIALSSPQYNLHKNTIHDYLMWFVKTFTDEDAFTEWNSWCASVKNKRKEILLIKRLVVDVETLMKVNAETNVLVKEYEAIKESKLDVIALAESVLHHCCSDYNFPSKGDDLSFLFASLKRHLVCNELPFRP